VKFHIVQQTTNSMPIVYHSCSPLDMRGKLPGTLPFLEPQCTHAQLSPFYHLSTVDVMHVRKDTRPSTFSCNRQRPGNDTIPGISSTKY